jgi:Flp pilus assembly protein TadD
LYTDELSRARQQAARGDVAGAAREFRMATRINGVETRAVYELGTLLLRTGRIDEADVEMERALRQHPRDSRVLSGLGDVRLAQQRYREAIDVYRHALERMPEEPALLNNLGTAYAELGEFDQAIAAYRASVAIKPGLAAKNLDRALRDKAARAAAQPP